MSTGVCVNIQGKPSKPPKIWFMKGMLIHDPPQKTLSLFATPIANNISQSVSPNRK